MNKDGHKDKALLKLLHLQAHRACYHNFGRVHFLRFPFEFQIFVFIIIYIIGEILENYKIPSLSASLPNLGSQLHLIAAAFLAIILWLRLYQVRSSGQKMIDKLEPGDFSDS